MDPIVLKGSDLAELLGTPIGQILGFNFDPNARNSNQWTQVPIQIDEMHYQSWETIKNEPDCRKVLNRSWRISTTPNTTKFFLIIFKLIQQAIMVILSCLAKKNQNLNLRKKSSV